MRELEIGNPSRLSVDVGPVISGRRSVISDPMLKRCVFGITRLMSFYCHRSSTWHLRVADDHRDLERSPTSNARYSGRYSTSFVTGGNNLQKLIDQINASGYGLTFGLHSRIDETIARVSSKIEAGNIYVNRNIIGAVVGVQPFGGCGLSGTGPKAGGPLYLGRLFARPRGRLFDVAGRPSTAALTYLDWLRAEGRSDEARCCAMYMSRSLLGMKIELAGPVGERNMYLLERRGAVAALAESEKALLIQIGAILATGNQAVVQITDPARSILGRIPGELKDEVRLVGDWRRIDRLEAILFDGSQRTSSRQQGNCWRQGPIVPVVARFGRNDDYDLDRLVKELSISINTAAAGGNASLMSIG